MYIWTNNNQLIKKSNLYNKNWWGNQKFFNISLKNQETIHWIPPNPRGAAKHSRVKVAAKETKDKVVHKSTIKSGPWRSGASTDQRAKHLQPDDKGEPGQVGGPGANQAAEEQTSQRLH